MRTPCTKLPVSFQPTADDESRPARFVTVLSSANAKRDRDGNRGDPTGYITLRGRWLAEIGFDIGMEVQVDSRQRAVLLTVDEIPEPQE